MTSSAFVRVVQVLLVLGVVSSRPVAARATDNGGLATGTVDCGDPNTNAACVECGSGAVYPWPRIICCPLVGPCKVVNTSTSTALPSIRASLVAGGLKLSLQRKGDSTGVDVKLKAGLLPHVFPRATSLKVHVTGTGARVGALLYPLAWLQNGAGAQAVLNAHGYDIAVTSADSSTSCSDRLPQEVCNRLATQLARSISAALESTVPEEEDDFLNGVHALGLSTCQVTP